MAELKDYTVKKVKFFRGHDGDGFNADLYYKGKKVAEVLDDAWGGEFQFDWLDTDKPAVDVNKHNHKDEPFTYKGSPAEKAFVEMCDRLPKWKSTFEPYNEFRHGPDTVIDQILNEFEENKTLKRWCKKFIVIITKKCKSGEYIKIKGLYDATIKPHIERRYKSELVEIVNDRF